MSTTGEFVEADEDELDFAADSPKGVIKRKQQTGGGDRSTKSPDDEIDDHRKIGYGDPHVHDGVQTLLDWIVGDGFNLTGRHITGGETQERDDSEVVRLRELMHNSNFWSVFNDWVQYAIIDGTAFMELVVEDEQFKPKLLPSKRMAISTDEYGRVEEYILEAVGGGDDVSYEPHEVAELYFRKEPAQDFGRSFIEPIKEQADMLRDMELDYTRFIATKAYPPIIWKLGDTENGVRWTEDQVDNWLDTVQSIEPNSMLAAGDDVDADVVGVTSTSSSAGAMRLEGTFEHLENRVITGLGLPAIIMNEEGGGGGQAEAVASMPSFKRRIRRLQNIVKSAVEQQVLKSLMVESGGLEDFDGVLPEFEFGEYSSSEKRLEVDKLLKLFNNGALTPEAFAERVGIDVETELPDMWKSGDLLETLLALSGRGDSIQNPEGGSPTDTEGGADSAGGEATSRQDPGSDSSNSRNKKAATEDES